MNDMANAMPKATPAANPYTFSIVFFFFFSSRRRHTRWNCDWSSDVCSSDLATSNQRLVTSNQQLVTFLYFASNYTIKDYDGEQKIAGLAALGFFDRDDSRRSEERRVGKECRSRW